MTKWKFQQIVIPTQYGNTEPENRHNVDRYKERASKLFWTPALYIYQINNYFLSPAFVDE